jgi:nitrogen fixation/metabolism regulation signal transduction histidine kinase
MSYEPRPQRKLRNYLLDPSFQLKFTAYLVTASLAIALLLGAFLWRSSQVLLRQTHDAVDARSRAAEASHELGNVALSSALMAHVNDPHFGTELQARSAAIDKEYEVERAAIEAQRAQLVRQQNWTWVGLLMALIAFIGFIAFAGIVFTHRIAGPIFRMKRMVAEIGQGKLVMPDRALRPKDELHELFDALANMISRLRELQRQDLETLEKVSAEVERGGLSAPAAELRTLQSRLRERLASTAT